MVILAGKVYSTCSYAGANPGESGTGLIKVITLKPVTESKNWTNTWALQTWQVVGRCHLFLLQQTPLATSQAKTPVTGRFTVNAVCQEPRRGPLLVPDDSQCLLRRKRQQEPLGQAPGGRFRPVQQR